MNIVIVLFLLLLTVAVLPEAAKRIREKRLREQRLKELEQLWQRPVQSPMDDWEYKGD